MKGGLRQVETDSDPSPGNAKSKNRDLPKLRPGIIAGMSPGMVKSGQQHPFPTVPQPDLVRINQMGGGESRIVIDLFSPGPFLPDPVL